MRDRYDFSDSEPNPYAERMKRQVTAGDHKQALSPGFRLGAYRVARVLGVGGFGVTYLCEHTGLAVQVAVKEYLLNEIAVPDGTEVHPKSSGDREGFEWGLSRFLDEARTLARFEHPNVARAGLLRGQQHRLHRDGWRAARLLLRRRGALTEGQLKGGCFCRWWTVCGRFTRRAFCTWTSNRPASSCAARELADDVGGQPATYSAIWRPRQC